MSFRMPCLRFVWIGCVLAVLPTQRTVAQGGPRLQQPATGSALATRAALREELARLETGDAQSRSLATVIQARLESGDFQPGDRVFLRVEGEPQLTDTFTVSAAQELELAGLGSLPLHGVLRSELQEHLQQYLARFLRNPGVQVRPLTRLLVEGEVVRPGFYLVAPQQPLTDIITEAGGLTPRAKPTDIRVERGSERMWSGDALRPALSQGYSLDQLSMRAGDRVIVPGHYNPWPVIGFLLALPVALLSLSQLK